MQYITFYSVPFVLTASVPVEVKLCFAFSLCSAFCFCTSLKTCQKHGKCYGEH